MKNSDGVWIPKYDTFPAEAFGTITPVLPSGFLPHSNSGQMIAEITSVLKNYTDDDYLLAIGNPTLIACCGAIAAHYNNGLITVLEWNRYDQCYEPKECLLW